MDQHTCPKCRELRKRIAEMERILRGGISHSAEDREAALKALGFDDVDPDELGTLQRLREEG